MITNDQDKEAANKAASENMEQNKEQQDKGYRQAQNNNEETSLTDSDGPGGALSIKEQNRNRLRDEKDEDFGGEQLQ